MNIILLLQWVFSYTGRIKYSPLAVSNDTLRKPKMFWITLVPWTCRVYQDLVELLNQNSLQVHKPKYKRHSSLFSNYSLTSNCSNQIMYCQTQVMLYNKSKLIPASNSSYVIKKILWEEIVTTRQDAMNNKASALSISTEWCWVVILKSFFYHLRIVENLRLYTYSSSDFSNSCLSSRLAISNYIFPSFVTC